MKHKFTRFRDTFDRPEKYLGAPVLKLKAAGPLVLDYCWSCSLQFFFKIYWIVELFATVVILLLLALAVYSAWDPPPWENAIIAWTNVAFCFLAAAVAIVCGFYAVVAKKWDLHRNVIALRVASVLIFMRALSITSACILFLVRTHPPPSIMKYSNWATILTSRNAAEFLASVVMFASWPLTIWLFLAFRTMMERAKRRMVRDRVFRAKQRTYPSSPVGSNDIEQTAGACGSPGNRAPSAASTADSAAERGWSPPAMSRRGHGSRSRPAKGAGKHGQSAVNLGRSGNKPGSAGYWLK